MSNILAIYRAFQGETYPPFRGTRPGWFSKFDCFRSFYLAFHRVADIAVVWDGDENILSEYIKTYPLKSFNQINEKNNGQSMMACYKLLEEQKNNYKFVYFSEDDWMYLNTAGQILTEGASLANSHFVTLYDRPHGYLRPSDDVTYGNDFIFRTRSSHWRTTESCMYSFGMPVALFDSIKDDLYKFCLNSSGAVDREMFRHFYRNGIRLFNPIPGQATHCVTVDLPLDWKYEN